MAEILLAHMCPTESFIWELPHKLRHQVLWSLPCRSITTTTPISALCESTLMCVYVVEPNHKPWHNTITY